MADKNTSLPDNTIERVDPDTGEVMKTKAIAVSHQGPKAVTIGGVEYSVIKRVNLPTLKHESGEVVVVRLDDVIREELSEREEEAIVDGVKRMITRSNTINVVRVTELSSKQPFEYVCNAMTADNLRSAYPSHAYVGHCFAIQKLGTVAGKRYKETNVVEIEPTEGLAPAVV